MRTGFRNWMLGVSLALLVMPAVGCDGGKDELIAKGRRAAKNENIKQALDYFKQALDKDPDDYNALWGMADAYRRDGNLVEQAKILEQIMGRPDMIEKYAAVVKPALETNYRKQADVVIGSEPEKAEGFLRKAIEINKKSEANATLGKLLMDRGDELLRKADFAAAKKAYDAAMEQRISRRMRSQLKGKAEIAEFMTFKKTFMPRLDGVKAELIEAKVYDEDEQMFTLTAEAEIDAKPDEENYEKNADLAGLAAVTNALNDITWKVAGKERPEGASVAYSSAVVIVVDKGWTQKKRPRTYAYRIQVPLDAVIEQVQKVDAGEFKQPEPAAPDGGVPAEGGKPDAGK